MLLTEAGSAMPMTGKEMLKYLTKHGWQVIRTHGSHHILAREGNAETLSVPVHGNKTLATGTEIQILKKAGLR